MSRQRDRSTDPHADDVEIKARMHADLPFLLREVRLRARRRRARAVVAGALCLTPIVWAAVHLSSQRVQPVPIHTIVHNDNPPANKNTEPTPVDPPNSHVIGDDEFFRLMNRAGYDVGLVRRGGETIVIGFEPPARETGESDTPPESPGSSSLE